MLVSETKQKKAYHHLDAACIISHNFIYSDSLCAMSRHDCNNYYSFLSRILHAFFGTTSEVTVIKSMENSHTPQKF